MVQGATGNRVIGAVVDGVSDVLNVDAADIQPAPDFGTAVNTEFVSGLVAIEGASSAVAIRSSLARVSHSVESGTHTSGGRADPVCN